MTSLQPLTIHRGAWIKIAEITALSALDKSELLDLVSGILPEKFVLHEHFLNWLYEMTGGHPFFVKLLVNHIFELFKTSASVISNEDMIEVLDMASHSPIAHYTIENIYHLHFSDHEKRIILLLTIYDAPVIADELERYSIPLLTSAYHLYERGYVSKDGGLFNLRIKFLKHWARWWLLFAEETERLGVNQIAASLRQVSSHHERKKPTRKTNRKRQARPLRVFLCHSTNDKQAVRTLYRRLSIESIDPWLDEEKLVPGQDWELEIKRALYLSDVVVVCLSRSSITKAGYVQKEIKYALDIADQQPEGTIFIVPLKLEECNIPERLRRWQWLNYFEEGSFEHLMRALQLRARTLIT